MGLTILRALRLCGEQQKGEPCSAFRGYGEARLDALIHRRHQGKHISDSASPSRPERCALHYRAPPRRRSSAPRKG